MTNDIGLKDNLDFRQKTAIDGRDLVLTENWRAMALYRFLITTRGNILDDLINSTSQEVITKIAERLLLKSTELGVNYQELQTILSSNSKKLEFTKFIGG